MRSLPPFPHPLYFCQLTDITKESLSVLSFREKDKTSESNVLSGGQLQPSGCCLGLSLPAPSYGHGILKIWTASLECGSSRHGLYACRLAGHAERRWEAAPARPGRSVLQPGRSPGFGREGAGRRRTSKRRRSARSFPATGRLFGGSSCIVLSLSHILYSCNVHIIRIWLKCSYIPRKEFFPSFLWKSSHAVENSCNIAL